MFRYVKVLREQYKLWAIEDTTLEIMDTVDDEIRRSRRIKAIESYAESAPQMILQIFILCRRVCAEDLEKNDGNFLITSTINLSLLFLYFEFNG